MPATLYDQLEDAILSGYIHYAAELFSQMTDEDDKQDIIDIGMMHSMAFCDVSMLKIFWPYAKHKFNAGVLSSTEETKKLRNVVLSSYFKQPFKWADTVVEMDDEACLCGDCVLGMSKYVKFDDIRYWQQNFDLNWPKVLEFLKDTA